MSSLLAHPFRRERHSSLCFCSSMTITHTQVSILESWERLGCIIDGFVPFCAHCFMVVERTELRKTFLDQEELLSVTKGIHQSFEVESAVDRACCLSDSEQEDCWIDGVASIDTAALDDLHAVRHQLGWEIYRNCQFGKQSMMKARLPLRLR